MSNNENAGQINDAVLNDRLNHLEERITALEQAMSGAKSQPARAAATADSDDYIEFNVNLPWKESDGAIETKVGEYGLTWLGNIVLFLGIAFLTHFISASGYPLFSFLIGIAAFSGILITARYIRKAYSYLAFIFTIFGHILLFYTVARTFYFTSPALIPNKMIVLAVLLLVAAFEFYEAIRRKSEGFSVLALLMTLTLAVLSDTTHLLLPLVTASAAMGMVLFNRFGWSRLLIISVILNYLVFLMWLVGNPLMGHELRIITSHQYCFLYLAICGAIYSMITLVKQKGLFNDGIILITIILNGIGFSFILGLVVIALYPSNYMWIFTSIAIFCLAFSALLKYRSPWKYSPALYALYGFVAVSVTVYGFFGFPKVYLYLAFQSLLVVSMALWFRSRIIVVMNLFLFLTVMVGYMTSPVNLVTTNFAFPLVGFFSARIINWQKERLKIKTELIRNTYLTVIFLTMLYAMYKAVPAQYITLSWTLVAVLYLLLSIILKNVKYRYMMFATLISTVFYLFAVDLARNGTVYRIIAFLFLAVISIGISVYYVNKIKKKKETATGT